MGSLSEAFGKRNLNYSKIPCHIQVTLLSLETLRSRFLYIFVPRLKSPFKRTCRQESKSQWTTCTELFIVNSKAIVNKNVRTAERHVLSISACVEIRQVSHTFRWSSAPLWGPRTVAFCQCGRLKSDTIFVFDFHRADSARHRPSTLSRYFSRVAFRTAQKAEREILPRLHSSRDNDIKWRHRLPISPPATFLSASHATLLSSVCRFPTHVLTNETVCSAIHSQINYWQKWNGEWKRDP